MKKFITLVLVVLISLSVVSTVFAGAKNGVYFDWYYKGAISGYFMATSSGIVHLWSYDRPESSNAPGDMHYIYKPLDKFPEATCDLDAVFENHAWKAKNLYNILDSTEKAAFLLIFPDLDQLYLSCGYQID